MRYQVLLVGWSRHWASREQVQEAGGWLEAPCLSTTLGKKACWCVRRRLCREAGSWRKQPAQLSPASPPVLGLLLPGACPGPPPLYLEGQHLEKWIQRGEDAPQTSDLKTMEQWLDPEIIRLSEISQTKERQISYDIIYMRNRKYDTKELIYKTETDSQT